MMLTELYYYYGNHPPAKVGSRPDFSFSPATESCTPPKLAADDLIDGLEAALRRVTTLRAHASPPLVNVARRSLAALRRARIAGRLANVSDQLAREFRLRPEDLESRSREQRIAFARQLTMCLCRKITGAPFESIGEHFNRNTAPLFTPTSSSSGGWHVMPRSGCSSRNWEAGLPGRCPQPRRRQREVHHDQSYVAQRPARWRGVVASPRPLAARHRNRPGPRNLPHQVHRHG
jgi:Bacterial dnaA protein helix-turn-helix